MDVIIAPTRLLGKGDRSRTSQSVNEQSSLPLGNRVAIVKDTFDDRYTTTEFKSPMVTDAISRNEQNIQQQHALVNMSLVGKESSNGPKHVHDQSCMKNFNDRNTDKRILQAHRDEETQNFNLVATPFVQAKPIFPEILNI